MVDITYFSDLLCIWAYASQSRIDAIKEKFADAIGVEHRFVSVFGDIGTKITSTWKDKGGYEGFNGTCVSGERVSSYQVHPDVWLTDAPLDIRECATFHKSGSTKRIGIGRGKKQLCVEPFGSTDVVAPLCISRDCRDIRWDIQCEIAAALGADIGAIEKLITVASHSRALQRTTKTLTGCESKVVRASSERGRQKLYGNVGFHLIEANIQELLRAPRTDEASWG